MRIVLFSGNTGDLSPEDRLSGIALRDYLRDYSEEVRDEPGYIGGFRGKKTNKQTKNR